MKTFDGYSKEKFSDTSVLLAGGGSKELSNFIGTLNWDSTNRKLQYKKIGDTNWNDLATFGSNALNSTSYLPLTGGTMTGLLTTTSGGSHKGIKVGNTYINAIDGNLIFQNNSSIRFGGDSWDYNIWAGLKYVHSSKTIYLGLADNSAFTANSAQSGGKLYLPGINNIYTGNGTNLVWHAGNDGSGSGLDADLLDGIHANGLFTAFSNAGSQTTRITIGGVTKDLKIDADTVDGYHASSFYKHKTLRSNLDSIYDLRWNYGKYDKGDFWGTYKDEYPTNYGAYLSLTYTDKNIGALMFFDAPTSNVLGHIYVRTRGAGDNNTTYSEWGKLAYITDNVASATKLQTSRTLWGQPFDGTSNVNGNITMNGEYSLNAYMPRKRADGGGWTYAPFKIRDADNNTFVNMGVRGDNSILSYIFIGCNTFNSSENLRIYPNGKVFATGFEKNGSDNSYVLLGGGGHKAVSDFAMASHDHNRIKGPDARSSNNTPQWYMSNRGSGSITSEFSSQGTSVLGGTYTNLTTFTPWIDSSGDYPVQLAFNLTGMAMRTSASTDAWNGWPSGNIYAGNFYTASDIHYKKIQSYIKVSVKQLAKIPLFNFTWTDVNDNMTHSGTSAQKVKKFLPHIVTGSDKLTLDYATLGTIAGITACKELVNQKSEIDVLKERIKELEQKLKIINNN